MCPLSDTVIYITFRISPFCPSCLKKPELKLFYTFYSNQYGDVWVFFQVFQKFPLKRY